MGRRRWMLSLMAGAAVALLVPAQWPPREGHAATTLVELFANGFTGDAAVDFNFDSSFKFTAE